MKSADPTTICNAESCSVILLSPRLRNRNTLLAHLNSATEESVFYALTPADTTAQQLVNHLVETLNAGQPHANNRAAKLKPHAAPEALAEYLLAQIERSPVKLHQLTLDALDYLPVTSDVLTFFEYLATHLSSDLRLVINSRTLPRSLWTTLIKTDRAVVLSDEGDDTFSQQPIDQPYLEVNGLAGGTVYADGLRVIAWDGPLPRNLFYFLVDRPLATRDEIFETFWPGLSVREATNVFHVTKRKINERIGFEITAYFDRFYRHSDQVTFLYDVAVFESAIDKARLASAEVARDAWTQAIKLYRVPFLYSIDMPWIVERRATLKQAYVEALVGMARWHQAKDEAALAISFYQRAQREQPEREDVCRDLMALYNSQGKTDLAVTQYRALQTRLKSRLGVNPSAVTRLLYEQIAGRSD